MDDISYLRSVAEGLEFCARAGLFVSLATCAISSSVAAANNLEHEKGTRSNALMVLKWAGLATAICAAVVVFVP